MAEYDVLNESGNKTGNPADIRWKQRFQNFRRAYNLLREALEDKTYNELSQLQREGVIQRFEYTFELGWKVFKDYLDYAGITLTEAAPRKVIKECAAAGIFDEAGIAPQVYIDMMLARNALSHTYNFAFFEKVIMEVKNRYLPELDKEYNFFIEKELLPNA